MEKTEKQEIVWREVMKEMAIFEFQDWLHPRIGLSKTLYTERRIHAPTCCPSCFELVQKVDTQCPNCGFSPDISMIEALRDNAFELAVFAWNYRMKYEEAVEKDKLYKGRVAEHYHLEPPADWLIYLASIAFAAIIGGLSYDAFKKLISSIRSSFRNLFHKELPRRKWLYQFYSNLKEYSLGKRNPDSPIFRAYVEGLIKGSELRASFEHSPDFDTKPMKTLQSIANNVGSETVELEIPDPSHIESPSEAEIRKHLRNILKQHAKMNLAVKKLQKYLAESQRKNV